jgi:hypothetical protein
VPDFLSPAWVESLDRAARRSRRLAACATDETLVLEQRVELPSGAEHAHHLVMGPRETRVFRGRADRPDVVLCADLATARDLARGTVNAQHALTTGRLQIRGNVGALVGRSEELTALDDVFAAVRGETTFPPSDETPVASTA